VSRLLTGLAWPCSKRRAFKEAAEASRHAPAPDMGTAMMMPTTAVKKFIKIGRPGYKGAAPRVRVALFGPLF
jgi:hypothetical protein